MVDLQFPLPILIFLTSFYPCLRTPPLFFRLALNAFRDIKSVGRIKKKLQQNQKKSRNRRPWYPRMTLKVKIYLFRLTKCTIYSKKNVPVFVPAHWFLYAVTMLIFQIKRIISSEKWFNYVVTFFFGNSKNVGRSDDAKRRKRGDGLRVRRADQTKQKCREGKLALCLNKRRENATTWHIMIDRNISCA